MFDFVGLGNGLIDVAVLLVFLVVLVVVHEFGHFITARRAGVTVHEFGIGFPPRAKVLGTDKHGTEYTLNWLPFGGFVKLEGEVGVGDADPRALVNQGLGTKVVILLAGVVLNLLLAFAILVLIAGLADPVASARIGVVLPGSPAATAGLHGGNQIGTDADGDPIYDETGDLIVAIDGHIFPLFDITDSSGGIPQSAYLRAHAGQTVTLRVRHADGSEANIPVTLRPPAEVNENQGALGVRFSALPTEYMANAPLDAVSIGFRRTLDATTLVLRKLGDFVRNLDNPPIQGPIGIVDTIGQVRSIGQPIYLIYLFALLSANLAVVNALPLPPLDGSKVAVAVIQRISGNRVSVNAERLAYALGFGLILALLVWVSFFDIQRLG